MITFYNLQHALHHGKLEMFRGELAPCFEVCPRELTLFGRRFCPGAWARCNSSGTRA